MQHPDGRRIVFPFHTEVDRYTLKGALRDGAVELEDFLRQIRQLARHSRPLLDLLPGRGGAIGRRSKHLLSHGIAGLLHGQPVGLRCGEGL